MAERRNMKVKMSLSSVSCYLFILTLLDVAVKSQMSSNSNNNAFIQGSNDVRYLVDTIPVSMHKEFSSSTGTRVQNVEESTMFSSKAHLKFEPPLLDFKERHLGVPHHEKVTILNLNNNKTIHMSSISGNTVHFHSSFFEDKIIPPLGNTSFNVVFLGREEGEIESSLFIHTSEGSFKYKVKGASIQSPYRIRPLSGVRLPLNASYSPLINIHNPHSQPLQLVEVYSSGGEFHLELPSGELEGPKHLWEIPAFLTKPIIRVRFHARAQKNHTAYIRLKVNNSEEVLVVPLEVEVGGACGLYSSDDVLDFGIGGSQDPPKQLKLWLRNSWKKPIRIQNVISMPVSKAVKIDFQPVKVPPDVTTSTQVAVLTFDWKTALETGHSSGKVVVKSKQSGQKLVIPYTSIVLAGGLSYDSQITRFRSDSAQIPARPFHLTNNYKVPVAITNASLSKDASKHFEVSKFKPQILEPGQSAKLLEIGVIRGTTISPDLKLESVLHVHTNISALTVPLLCYNGKLVKVILSARNESELELGTVGSETEKKVYFALINENPVAVGLRHWRTDLPLANISLVAIESGNLSSVFSKLSWQNTMTQETSIGPGQYGLFLLVVRSGGEVGEAHGKVWVQTEFERLHINAHMRIEHGSLEVTPDPVIFDECFPGKICSHKLLVQSLFSVAMAVTGVNSIPADPRLRFIPTTPPILSPSGSSHIGELSWDAEAFMLCDNYLGISQNTTAGSTRWLDTLELPAHTRDYDLSLLAARYEQYLNLSSHFINLTLRLDTTEVRDHSFGVQVHLSWPNLVIPSSLLQFPLTQVGNTTYKEIIITNPGSRYSLVVQITMENYYPMADGIMDSIPERLRPSCSQCSQSNPSVFLLEAGQSDYVNQLNGVNTHRDTLTYLLPPLINFTLRVGFAPTSAQLSSSLLIIRNNLTVLETLQMYGSGAYAQFKFGNRKPGSSTPLVFELAEKHLKDCEREKQRKFPAPNLTVKRSFTARNTGALPISVHGFQISGLPCEGYGFRVLNCEPFYLAPNATRKVDIAFTPDFTLARVQRTLSVLTSEGGYGDGKGAANYTLVATLPPYLLATCSSVLARPTWEPLLYYSAVTFMVFLLFCVLAAAFLESDRALKCALVAMSRDNSTVQPVLDLRSVGAGVGLGNVSTENSIPPVTVKNTETTPEVSTWSPPQNSSCTATADQEVIKERTKCETENVAAVFTNSGNKCNKKKVEKVVISKRMSDPMDCIETSQTKDSWTNIFKGSLIETHPNNPSNKTSTSSSSSSSCGTDTGSFPIQTLPKQVDKSDQQTKCPQVSQKDQTNIVKVTPIQRLSDVPKENRRRFGGSKKNSPNNGCNHKQVVRENIGCTGTGEDAETSSTTTESSTHDDGDKEVEATMSKQQSESINTTSQKTLRPRSKATSDITNDTVKPNIPNERSGGSASSLEPDWDEDERTGRDPYESKRKTNSNGRNGRKQGGRNGKQSDPNNPTNTGRNRNGNNGNKQQNKNKEKQMATRKRSNDKSVPSTKGLLSIFDTTIVPPPPPAVWGEPRASFSDVVARSDSYSSVLAPRHISDNSSVSYGQNIAPLPSSGPTPLGPIGPRKSSPSNIWSNWTESNETAQAPPPTTSSLFMDTLNQPTNQSIQPGGFGVWSEPNLLLKMLQAEEQRRIEEEEYQRRTAFQDSWPAVNSLWNPLYTSSARETANTRSLETGTVNGSLMWGSDVWAPTPPPTAPWAPPGLAPRPPVPRHEEEHVAPNSSNDVEHGLEYDPFRSLSNIWSPHTSNIWKPPTSK